MKELFLFVRPPRPLWPFNGPASAVWPPLAFASMAAALRDHARDLRVAILDAPALRMGWRSLEAEMRNLQPAYIGMGEEAVTCTEGLRLARLAKQLRAQVIAGGCFFGHVPNEAIGTRLVDVVVHGEGEITLVELVEALRSGRVEDLYKVAGISFADGDEVVHTPPRPLIQNLDRLPFPAYDLLPVDHYGQGSRNHPDLAALELSRGCVGSCDFCILWRQMGQTRDSALVPCFRTKSPERLLEEIRVLTTGFHRRYLSWVDPCFNADPDLPRRLADLLLKENIRVGQSAWMRADAIVRDAASGALAHCVRAGLNEAYLGIERCDPDTLHSLHRNLSPDVTRQALQILTRDFPEVFTVGSFIYGLPEDTQESVHNLVAQASRLPLDYIFYIPLTPLPGTPFWRPEMWDPTGAGFRSFGFLPGPLVRAKRATLEQAFFFSNLFHWNLHRIGGYLQGTFHRNARKRRLLRRLMFRGGAFQVRRMLRTFLDPSAHCGMRFPRWYEN
jgi:anaerobic magnesium-protoporphyrin IX monomethyl ester cyclase